MQSLTTPLLFVIALAVLGYFVAKARAMQVAGGDIRGLVSLPKQHALNTLLATVIPAIGAVLLISLYSRIAGTTPGWFFSLVVLGLGITGFVLSLLGIKTEARARIYAERWIMGLLVFSSSIAIMTTVGIVFSMLFETFNFFGQGTRRRLSQSG